MLVSYTYRSDEAPPEDDGDSPRSPTKQGEVKTFQFYTVVDLGAVVSKETVQTAEDS